jgi:hypothetical protein
MPENQAEFPLVYEKLPSRKKKLPQRKFFGSPILEKIKRISGEKSLHIVP